MEINLPLSPETERKLRQQAQAAGQDLQRFVLDALEEKLRANSIGDLEHSLSTKQRIDKLMEWASSHRHLPFEADDSRESIYQGRGE